MATLNSINTMKCLEVLPQFGEGFGMGLFQSLLTWNRIETKYSNNKKLNRMKDFMLVIIGDSYADLNLSPEQIQERMGKWFAWTEKMKAQGVYQGGNALTDTIKRVSGPDRVVTDRASTEVKELIGGYYLVKARDYDHAVEIAQDYPDYDLDGTIEIREIMYF